MSCLWLWFVICVCKFVFLAMDQPTLGSNYPTILTIHDIASLAEQRYRPPLLRRVSRSDPHIDESLFFFTLLICPSCVPPMMSSSICWLSNCMLAHHTFCNSKARIPVLKYKTRTKILTTQELISLPKVETEFLIPLYSGSWSFAESSLIV